MALLNITKPVQTDLEVLIDNMERLKLYFNDVLWYNFVRISL